MAKKQFRHRGGKLTLASGAGPAETEFCLSHGIRYALDLRTATLVKKVTVSFYYEVGRIPGARAIL